MGQIGIEGAFISHLLCCISDKPECRAVVDVAIGFVGDVDFCWLQRSQHFNQIAEHGTASVSGRRAVYGCVGNPSESMRMSRFLGELLADHLVFGTLIQVVQFAVRIAQHDEVIVFSTQNPKCCTALHLAETRKCDKIIRTDLVHRFMFVLWNLGVPNLQILNQQDLAILKAMRHAVRG